MWKARRGVLTPVASRGAAASAWTPLSLGSKLLAYSSVSLSVTKTGANITQVNDLSGDGFHFVAAGAPQYGATSFNGGPGATFDGVDDWLRADSAAHGGTDKLSGFISAQVTTGASTTNRIMSYRQHGGFVDLDTDAAPMLQYYTSGEDGIKSECRSGVATTDTTGAGNFLLDTPYRIGMVYDGSVLTLYLNNVAQTNTGSTSGNMAATADLLIANGGTAAFGICPMVAQSWIFMKGAADSTERSNIDSWLQSPV